jgi:hypothetical protein
MSRIMTKLVATATTKMEKITAKIRLGNAGYVMRPKRMKSVEFWKMASMSMTQLLELTVKTESWSVN